MKPIIYQGGLTGHWFLSTRYRVHNAEKNQHVALNQTDITEQVEAILAPLRELAKEARAFIPGAPPWGKEWHEKATALGVPRL